MESLCAACLRTPWKGEEFRCFPTNSYFSLDGGGFWVTALLGQLASPAETGGQRRPEAEMVQKAMHRMELCVVTSRASWGCGWGADHFGHVSA